ncbi:diguanylate cyclase (GGDEF) domain-containing protein [Fulvimarina manganoxydans]|uniref:Diguanylate cyclase (GGDEF) domain-containing protein n=1 Tax=Fulvimarina manganoxydans TaxID=937218 RepID=A0A1W2EPZ5_9HYPH|nr:diguanylate cyclase (GGDEF) domain-containing protein [Fulvimarina manganoxydans]
MRGLGTTKSELDVVRQLNRDPLTWFASCVTLASVCVVMALRAADPTLLAVTASIIVVTGLRGLATLRFYRMDKLRKLDPSFERRLYSVLGGLHAGLIGVWVALMTDVASGPLDGICAALAGIGFLIGTIGRNYASTETTRIQVAALCLPVIAGLVYRGSPDHLLAASIFAVVAVVALMNARRVSANYQTALAAKRLNVELASRDLLTRLPNRGAGERELSRRTQAGETAPFALLFVDIDRFHRINDKLSHAVADRLLKSLARTIRATAGKESFVARHAGDQFLILAPVAGKDRALSLAASIQSAIARPQRFIAPAFNITASVGIAEYTLDGTDSEELLHAAEIALNRAKALGGARTVVYKTWMDEEQRENDQLESDLAEAIRHRQLTMAYQPIFGLETGRIVACEALVRWNHPERGAISPALFVPLAEASGLIDGLTELTLDLATSSAAAWPDEILVAVNISPSQLKRGNFDRMLAKALARNGLPAQRLEIEITENLFVEEDEDLAKAIEALRALGVRFAIDDFGTGYSNIGYLSHMPIDKIKIDRKFLTGIHEDRRQAGLLRSFLGFVDSLDMAVVVEGVETHDQLSFLADCAPSSLIQGFLLSRPIPDAELATLWPKEVMMPWPAVDSRRVPATAL